MKLGLQKNDAKTFSVFRKKVWSFYYTHKRYMPWRNTIDPYRIMVSEIMLQQTQVSRVVEKYNEFIKRFPTISHLARAKTADVIRLWQGLGYNRRALYLKRAAVMICSDYNGIMPTTVESLDRLPGIGQATAAAICVYAYNTPLVFIETNIRTVFIYHFFQKHKKVSDISLLPYIQGALDQDNPREWYWALMDYGAYLKKTVGNVSKKSKQYTKQSLFKGSDREIRGTILCHISVGKVVSIQNISRYMDTDTGRVSRIVSEMIAEGLIIKRSRRLLLP